MINEKYVQLKMFQIVLHDVMYLVKDQLLNKDMHQRYTKTIFDEHLDVINDWLKVFVHKDDLYIVVYLF